ncbi:hypothetical protein [Streptomyces sp. NK08204]|uniref:hypothetical protein n=1 Tax=Streptomyces sp. NK08204 TaxID=2873260 RepID=UPI001CEDC6BB|nr:hypothetical protein [Streptomyces sp. NK08204]
MSDGRIPFEADIQDDVHVSGFIERDNSGAPVITTLTVSCTTEHNMNHLLRRLRLGEVLQQAIDRPIVQPPPPAPVGPQRRGRQALPDDLLKKVAEAYLRETAHGRPPGAVKRLAAEFDRPEETVRSWIARARSRGWLGPSRQGRRGAEPGPRLTA